MHMLAHVPATVITVKKNSFKEKGLLKIFQILFFFFYTAAKLGNRCGHRPVTPAAESRSRRVPVVLSQAITEKTLKIEHASLFGNVKLLNDVYSF